MESKLKLSCFRYKNISQHPVIFRTIRITHSTEILSFPLLDGSLRLEVAQIFETQSLIPVTQLCCSLFATLNDCINVVVDHEAETPSVLAAVHRLENSLFIRVDNLLSTVSNHFQKLILVRGYSKWVNPHFCAERH